MVAVAEDEIGPVPARNPAPANAAHSRGLDTAERDAKFRVKQPRTTGHNESRETQEARCCAQSRARLRTVNSGQPCAFAASVIATSGLTLVGGALAPPERRRSQRRSTCVAGQLPLDSEAFAAAFISATAALSTAC